MALRQTWNWLFVLTAAHLLEIYALEYLSGMVKGCAKKIGILHNVECFQEMREGVALVALNRTLEAISFAEIAQQTEIHFNIDLHAMRSLAEVQGQYALHCSPTSRKIFLTRAAEN